MSMCFIICWQNHFFYATILNEYLRKTFNNLNRKKIYSRFLHWNMSQSWMSLDDWFKYLSYNGHVLIYIKYYN